MPRYPTPGEYQEALQFPYVAFSDPELQVCEPDTGPLGLPQAMTGSFAAVFPVYTASGKHALKCFLSEVPDQQTRYRAIARYLSSDKARVVQRYVVPFDYQAEGIRVGDGRYPLLKMGWSQGIPLNRFVDEHVGDADLISSLAGQWAQMLADLDGAGIAHGDLQHGNVLVAPQDDGFRLVLVDYDTMYVPSLKGRRSPEAGHRNYEHPDRGERDYGPWLDHFAGLAIYVALRACILKPELWERYDSGENMLFRAADFYDPAGSYLFKDLAELEELRTLVEALHTACLIEPHSVPSLAQVQSGVRVSRRVRGALYTLRGIRQREGKRGEEPRSLVERVFLPGVLLWCLATIGFAIAGAPVAAMMSTLGGATIFGMLALFSYVSQPIPRRKKRLQKEVAFFERTAERLQREVDSLETERRRVLSNMDELRAEHLASLREQKLEDCLKHHFIGEVGQLPGVPHRLVVRLKMHGIRTAYHATDDRLAAVTEVGVRSRSRVAQWRADLVNRYASGLPEKLSPAEERRLERYVYQRVDALRAEAERVREKRRVQERERAEVLERQAGLPELSFGRYVRYLLRLGTLPAFRPRPPKPAPVPTPNQTPQANPTPVGQNGSDPWWRE